ncbi:protein kinase domain-containing protein [Bacillus fonticola]|uniref:protein kinase domain-containing protein n=1 Tax=Bacillus fonticola TaxID=2728853 RepID=UPI0038996800
MNPQLKNQFNLRAGTTLYGKWHHRSYTIVKELGFGANGTVYLAKDEQAELVAVKLSQDTASVTSEVNVLKSFAKVQGSSLGPSLLDVDDCILQGKQVPFYVMEYIQGEDLLTFVKKRGHSWTGVLLLQLLSDLQRLHEQGWVFGDLKPENLLVTGSPVRIRCIDVGGTTLQGRAVKEYTEFFDRGYWGMGGRKADPAYDLFAVAMVTINTVYPKRFEKSQQPKEQLQKALADRDAFHPYREVLWKAIIGAYVRAEEMRTDLRETLRNRTTSVNGNRTTTTRVHRKKKQRSTQQQKAPQTNKQATGSQQGNIQQSSQAPKSSAVESISLVALVSVAYGFYIYMEYL